VSLWGFFFCLCKKKGGGVEIFFRFFPFPWEVLGFFFFFFGGGGGGGGGFRVLVLFREVWFSSGQLSKTGTDHRPPESVGRLLGSRRTVLRKNQRKSVPGRES